MALMNKFKILFFGSDAFSINTLKPLVSRFPEQIQVLTKPTTKLDTWAQEAGLKRHHWRTEGLGNYDFETKPNIGIVSSFGKLIDSSTVDIFKYGLFNVHPSLLPKYRGSSPIQHAILNNDRHTGVTIIRIPPVEKFDIGDIVMQRKVPIITDDRLYARELGEILAKVGSEMVTGLLENYHDCLAQLRSQDHEGVTYAKKIQPEMGLIKFKEESSSIIDRKVRAYSDTIDLYFLWKGKKVKVSYLVNPYVLNDNILDKIYLRFRMNKPVPGSMIYARKSHALCCKAANGSWLGFRNLKLEDKPEMKALDFMNGYLSADCKHEDAVTDL